MVIAGAGMAGLCAAARARELGSDPVLLEKGDRPGGSMLLSSCVVWRHRHFDDFRRECPAGDERLQRLVFERLDEDLDWLQSLGAQVTEGESGNPRTVGRRFDPQGLTEALVRAVAPGSLRVSVRGQTPPQEAHVLCTGGFPVRLARERGLLLRANRWSSGDGLELGRSRDAAVAGDLGEFYGRAMPAVDDVGEADFVRLTQLFGRFATVSSEDGTHRFEGQPSWSETDLVQTIARWPGGRAWYTVDRAKLDERVRERTVREMIEAARRAGAPIREESDSVSVLVRASVTQTLGGLKIDEHARVLDSSARPIDGLFAAGADVGGIANGGYSSGLAAALVFGRIAAETALS